VPSKSKCWDSFFIEPSAYAKSVPSLHSLLPISHTNAARAISSVVRPIIADRRLTTDTEDVNREFPTLTGTHVRLEPLSMNHLDGLVAAAGGDSELYRWTIVPQGKDATARYIEGLLAARDAGTAVPFATVRHADDTVIGATRFMEMERWKWPPDHARHGRIVPDALEIGGTWLTRDAMRTAANTEAKQLMLTHAFEVWHVLRVCLHTDARNQRSQEAIVRIGGKFEGVLREHRLTGEFQPRDSYRYSIVAAEWPELKPRLAALLRS
jgi:RimJ/RimL family protein N-acetyltransferase